MIEINISQIEIQNKIQSLKDLLTSWDYKTSKNADGEYTEKEWQDIVKQRKDIREQIRNLEKDIIK